MRVYIVMYDVNTDFYRKGQHFRVDTLYTTEEGAKNRCLKFKKRGQDAWYFNKPLKGHFEEFIMEALNKKLHKLKKLPNNQKIIISKKKYETTGIRESKKTISR